jgi:3-oxoacyl-[acyl-carrier protein] reductase
VNLGLEGRVAVVTGGSRGIGFATATAFAREGASIAITYHHNSEQAHKLARELCEEGSLAVAVQLDLGSAASIEKAFDDVLERWKRIDILVNNAIVGEPAMIGPRPPFETSEREGWQRLLRANVEGVFLATQKVLPVMRSNRWGRIVFVSSAFAEDGHAGFCWYSAAKASLHGLTRSLSKEVAADGIFVNAVMPITTSTDQIQTLSHPIRERIRLATSLKRLLEPPDVATPILFLASAANTAISGEILRIGGGPA